MTGGKDGPRVSRAGLGGAPEPWVEPFSLGNGFRRDAENGNRDIALPSINPAVHQLQVFQRDGEQIFRSADCLNPQRVEMRRRFENSNVLRGAGVLRVETTRAPA